MAPARVRGCAGVAGRGLRAVLRQADASRRRNGPRKATPRRPITVRLRSKSCPDGGPDGRRPGRRGEWRSRCEPLSRRMWGRRPGRPGGCRPYVARRSCAASMRRKARVDIVVKGRQVEPVGALPGARHRAPGEGRALRPQDPARRRRGVQGAQPATGRPRPARRAHDPQPGPGRPGRGRGRRQVRRARRRLRPARGQAAQGRRPSPRPPQARGRRSLRTPSLEPRRR